MEYVRGRTLREIAFQPEEQRLQWCEQAFGPQGNLHSVGAVFQAHTHTRPKLELEVFTPPFCFHPLAGRETSFARNWGHCLL